MSYFGNINIVRRENKMNKKCENCRWHDNDERFCYYYLLYSEEIFEVEKIECKHWKKRMK